MIAPGTADDSWADEVWRRTNDLAWNLNWRGHARAVELARAAEAEGRTQEAVLWTAVEARLRPREPDGPARLSKS